MSTLGGAGRTSGTRTGAVVSRRSWQKWEAPECRPSVLRAQTGQGQLQGPSLETPVLRSEEQVHSGQSLQGEVQALCSD